MPRAICRSREIHRCAAHPVCTIDTTRSGHRRGLCCLPTPSGSELIQIAIGLASLVFAVLVYLAPPRQPDSVLDDRDAGSHDTSDRGSVRH